MSSLAISADIPLFRFGGTADSPAATLAIIGGGLILDNGEAERTFLYRCQDRFLTYAWLCGWRSLFFAIDAPHVEIYRGAIETLSRRLQLALRRCGLAEDQPTPEPLFVLLDPDNLQVRVTDEAAGLLRSIVQQQASHGVAMNQVSPTYAHLLKQLQTALLPYGVVLGGPPEDQSAEELAQLAMALHDKANYVALSQRLEAPARAAHVPTAVLAEGDIQLIRTWDELVRVLNCATGQTPSARIYVKASRYSAGNLAVSLSRDNFEARWPAFQAQISREVLPSAQDLETSVRELRAEIEMAPCLRSIEFTDEKLRRFKCKQAELRQRPRFLVQPELSCEAAFGTRYNGIGLTYSIGVSGGAHVATYAHIYRDPDRKHFLGAYLADDVASGVDSNLFEAVRQLCCDLAGMGYRGPVNFDARLGSNGSYRLIYDCNPRMTGVFPSLAIARALRLRGCSVASVLTLGYRGELQFTDSAKTLDRLAEAGVLWSRGASQGAIVLPNLCRDDGYDLHLVNVGLAGAKALLAPGSLMSECFSGNVPELYH
jgi:hypothetical protein